MDTLLRIHLSTGYARNLTRQQREFVTAIVHLLESEQLRVVKSGPNATLEERYEQIRQCHGCLTVAFPHWNAHRVVRNQSKLLAVSSEFAHVANTLAVAAGKPLLVLREKSVALRGTLKPQLRL